MNTINIGPKNWADYLNILLAIYTDGDAEGRKVAYRELARMADAADQAIVLAEQLQEEADEADE